MFRVISSILTREFVRTLVRGALKNKTFLYGVVLVLLVLFFSTKAYSANYEYKGVFPTQNVMLEFCDDCWLELPPTISKRSWFSM